MLDPSTAHYDLRGSSYLSHDINRMTARTPIERHRGCMRMRYHVARAAIFSSNHSLLPAASEQKYIVYYTPHTCENEDNARLHLRNDRQLYNFNPKSRRT